MSGPRSRLARVLVWAAAPSAFAAILIFELTPLGESSRGAAFPAPTPAPAATSTVAALEEPSLSALLTPGQRAITAAFVEVGPADQPLRAGEPADVVAIFRRGQAGVPEDAVALVRGVTVLAAHGPAPALPMAGDASATPADNQSGDAHRAKYQRKLFAVELSVEQAQLVALAQQQGELRIGRCSSAACDDSDLTTP